MAEPNRTTYRAIRRVEWHDTDAAGIAHFTAFLRYMEEAEHEFLRARGLSVFWQDDQGRLTWPRVSVKCDYAGSARFEDVLDIEVSIARLGNKSVTYAFAFTHDGRDVAQGTLVAACCRFDVAGHLHAVEIPPSIVERLGGR